MTFEIDASDHSIKQCLEPSPKQLVKSHSRTWTRPQIHYSTIKIKFLSIQNLF